MLFTRYILKAIVHVLVDVKLHEFKLTINCDFLNKKSLAEEQIYHCLRRDFVHFIL